MSTKRPLVPRFLNRLDEYLLLNKPDIWSARAHLILYYGLLFIIALTAVSFAIPDDPRSDSPVVYWIGFVIILSILSLTLWLIYLLRFNVFKRYGNVPRYSRIIVFLLYFLSVGVIAVFPLVMPYVESVRANKAYSDVEIVNDINAINIRICQLEYDSLPHVLKTDTLLVVNTLPKYQSMPEEETETVIIDTAAGNILPYKPHFKTTDTASLSLTLSRNDSSHKLNDSMYLLFNADEYMFAYSFGESGTAGYDSNFDLYKKVFQNFRSVDRKKTRSELYAILNKYQFGRKEIDIYAYNSEDDAKSRIENRYNIARINRNLRNITERKYRWRNGRVNDIMRVWYYVSLAITLLVFIYRHSTRKAFFLSWLTGVVLTILTSLCIAYFLNSDFYFYIWIAVYIVLFFLISLFVFRSKTRNTVTGIAINFFVLLITFLPTCIVGYYYELLLKNNREKDTQVFINYEAMSRNQWLAEVGGAVLLLILMATYIQKVYRKWYALPEE